MSIQDITKMEKIESETVADVAQNEKQETTEQTKEAIANLELSNTSKVAKVESESKGNSDAWDKELLQARYCC